MKLLIYFFTCFLLSTCMVAMTPEDAECLSKKNSHEKERGYSTSTFHNVTITDNLEEIEIKNNDAKKGTSSDKLQKKIKRLVDRRYVTGTYKHKQELEHVLATLCQKDPNLLKRYKKAERKLLHRNPEVMQAALQTNELFVTAVGALLEQKDDTIVCHQTAFAKKAFQQKVTACFGGVAMIAQFAFMILLVVKQIIDC